MVNATYATYYTFFDNDNKEIGTSMSRIRNKDLRDREFGSASFSVFSRDEMLAEEMPESYLDRYQRPGFRDRSGYHATEKPVVKMNIERIFFFNDEFGKDLGVLMVRATYDVQNNEFAPDVDRPMILKLTPEGEKFREAHAEYLQEPGSLDSLIASAQAEKGTAHDELATIREEDAR